MNPKNEKEFEELLEWIEHSSSADDVRAEVAYFREVFIPKWHHPSIDSKRLTETFLRIVERALTELAKEEARVAELLEGTEKKLTRCEDVAITTCEILADVIERYSKPEHLMEVEHIFDERSWKKFGVLQRKLEVLRRGIEVDLEARQLKSSFYSTC